MASPTQGFKDWLTASPVRFYFLAAVVAMMIVGLLDFYLWWTNNALEPGDVLVEAHGLVFDLIVLGVLLSIYELLKDKKEKKERYLEEIEDYRKWKEPEAAYRITGIVKRLNGMGLTNIDLSDCYLSEMDLSAVDLRGGKCWNSNFDATFFTNANLSGADFSGASLNRAYFKRAQLEGTIFSLGKLADAAFVESNLQKAVFQNANLSGADFFNADLRGCSLWGATISRANFQGAQLEGLVVDAKDWITMLVPKQVRGREEIEQQYQVVAAPHPENSAVSIFVLKKKQA